MENGLVTPNGTKVLTVAEKEKEKKCSCYE
jgi:hypothetical protein